MSDVLLHSTRRQGGLETSVERYLGHLPPTRYERTAHAAHAEERDRLIGALAVAHAEQVPNPHDPEITVHRRLRDRLMSCCRWPVVAINEEGTRVTLCEQTCRCRVCPRCSRRRADAVTDHVLAVAEAMDSPRMLTLTLASTSDPLESRISHLIRSFRRLRQRAEWKAHVRGGVWCIEVTINPSTGQWHPHAHCIIDGRFWAQAAIANAWESVTGDSRIVDIRVVHSRRDAAKYVAKYVAKAADTRSIPTDRVAEFAAAIAGQRLIQTFGASHAVKRPESGQIRDDLPARRKQLSGIMLAADEGDAFAEALFDATVALHVATARESNGDDPRIIDQQTADFLAAWSCWERRHGPHDPPPGRVPPPRPQDPALPFPPIPPPYRF